MNVYAPINKRPYTPDAAASATARESSRLLSPFAEDGVHLRVQAEGESVEIELPAGAVQLLVHILSEMAEGNAVTIVPIHAELTTQQAADLLGVSRPYLVQKLEEGTIPFHKVGTHRRVLFKDVMDYKDSIHQARNKTLDELSALNQELDTKY